MTLHPYLAHLAQHGLWEPPQRRNGHQPAATGGPPAAPDHPGGPRYAHAALLDECADVAATAEGSRNHRLNIAAYKLGQLAALGWIDPHDVTAALRAAGLAAGLGASETDATIASGLCAGQSEPRDVVLHADLADATFAARFGEVFGTGAPARGASEPHPAGALTDTADDQRTPAQEVFHRRCVEEEARKLAVRRDARRLDAARQRATSGRPSPLHTLPDRRLDVLLGQPRTPLAWRIADWQPLGGRVLLAAQYKAGKTTLVGNLARCLVDGDRWLGRHEVTPPAGPVVILDFEMGQRQLTDWLRDQRIQNTASVVVVPMRGQAGHFAILDTDVRAEWAAALRDLAAGYLILDCLRPVLDTLGLDEHHEAGAFLVALDALLGDAGIAEALVVQHMGHSGERSRGDSRIRDWPDVEWRLVRQDDDPASPRYITAYGRDVDIEETQLGYDATTRHLTLAGGNRRDAAARSALFDVIGVLTAAGQPLSGRQVETELAESDNGRRAVRDALRLGARLGSIATQPGLRRATLYSTPTSFCGN